MVTENMQNASRPAVGVGVIVTRNGRVLLGLRKGSHGDGCWQFPGGHLEYGEAIVECARRELLEETGLTLKTGTTGPYTSDVFVKECRHYITLFVLGEAGEGEPEVMEPDKCLEWGWFSWDSLPQPLFLPVQNLLKSGFNPFTE